MSSSKSEAVASLPIEHLEDARMVSFIKSVGPPPPLSINPSGQKQFGQPHKDWTISFLSQLYSPKLAAEILGVASSTLFYHKRSDPVFRKAWEQAEQDSHEAMLGIAMEEAHGIGIRHHVTKDGDIIEVPKDRNDKIITAFLNFRLGTRHIHEGLDGDDGGAMTIKISPDQIGKLTREERRQLTHILAKLEASAPITINGNDAEVIEHVEA